MATRNFIDRIRLFTTEKTERAEIASGFFIERRRFLWLPVFAATALISPRKLFAGGNLAPGEGAIVWEDFLKECLPNAGELHKDSSVQGQDAYLYWLASMAARLNLKTVPEAKVGRFGRLNPPVEFGIAYRGTPFFVVEWRLAPNAFLPPHCHPNASVCTVGTEGEATIRNFEIVGKAPEFSSNQMFNVRETHREMISTGRINTLSSTRDNIHTFQAGKDGARGIDISTYHGEDVGFSFLEIQEKPMDAGNHMFEANWKKL